MDSKRSFDNVQNWINSIREHCPGEAQVILIANKSDLDEEDRQVSVDQGKELSEKYGIQFFEVSALDGNNIE